MQPFASMLTGHLNKLFFKKKLTISILSFRYILFQLFINNRIRKALTAYVPVPMTQALLIKYFLSAMIIISVTCSARYSWAEIKPKIDEAFWALVVDLIPCLLESHRFLWRFTKESWNVLFLWICALIQCDCSCLGSGKDTMLDIFL